ncbi:MAG: hypothetical protein L0154_08045 [Chloroflexi bacterium]|nr:hypothetical protein [Chloroflexota bacterium]
MSDFSFILFFDAYVFGTGHIPIQIHHLGGFNPPLTFGNGLLFLFFQILFGVGHCHSMFRLDC